MTLFRTIVVLVGGLALLLVVVVLRAETTRLHFELSKCESRADEIRQELTYAELELARLRNPGRIRQQIQDALSDFEETKPPPPPPRRRDRR